MPLKVHEALPLMLVLLTLGVAALDARAETASDPAGFYKVDCLGNSDATVSIPFSRPEAAFALVESIAGNGVTVKGLPGWVTNQFVYVSETQSNTYYLRFLSSAKEGKYYPILANGTNSLDLDLNGDDISSVTNGTRLSVIPYWTLATAFPGGNGVIRSSALNHRTEILIPDFVGAGINLTPSPPYYFFTNASFPDGVWLQVNSQMTNKNDEILLPDIYFIVRHFTAANTVFTAQGSVPVTKLTTPIVTQPTSKQDNFVALTRPATNTLDESGLVQSGAFLPSPTVLNHTDELLVFDNSKTNRNKAPSATYYYLGTSNTWCRVNDAQGIYGTTDMGNQPVFIPATGVIVRKKAGSISTNWINSPTY